MQKFEEKQVTRTEKVFVELSCDLCGKVAHHPYRWEGGRFNVDETEISITIKQKEGNSYPEGGSGTHYEVDLCPECFKTKLIPWLVSQGARIDQETWEW